MGWSSGSFWLLLLKLQSIPFNLNLAVLPMPQLTPAERRRIDQIVRGKKASPTEAWHKINEKRLKANIAPVDKTAVTRYVNGETHNVETEDWCLVGNEMLDSLKGRLSSNFEIRSGRGG